MSTVVIEEQVDAVSRDCRTLHPKVSVVIPTYNSAHYITEAVDSVLSQTFKDFEIIVVDDGSTDHTKEVLQKYGSKIRYFYRKNGGTCAARNMAIKESKGEYIAFLDSDDLWLPNRLEKQVPLLDADPGVGFVCSSTHIIDEHGVEIKMWKRGIYSNETFNSLYEANYVWVPTVLMRKSCLTDIGMFDESLSICGDYDLWLRVAKKYKFKYIDIPLSKYRIHKNNISKNIPLHMKERAIVANKPQIVEGVGFARKRARYARDYYLMAKKYTSAGDIWNAGICYLRSVFNLPFVGFYYYPPETDKFIWSLPYRILNPYYLIIRYILAAALTNVQRRVFVLGVALIVVFYGAKSRAKKIMAIKLKKYKIGMLNIEFFHKDAGGFGGYGKNAMDITKHLNSSGHFKVDILLARPSRKCAIKILHDADVITSPDPESSNIINAFKYARMLDRRNIDLLITMEYSTDFQYPIFYLPNTPLIIWIRDPWPEDCIEKISTVSLHRKCFGADKAQLIEHQKNVRQSIGKIIKLSRLFGRRIVFACSSIYLIERAKRLYSLPDIAPTVLPTPIEIPELDNINYSSKPSVCLLGRLDPIKRPWIYFELAKRFKDVDFFVAGATHFPDAMDPIIKKYSSIPNLKFLGLVVAKEKDEILKKVWATINTSVHEGLPVSFLESFSYGKPIISCQNPDNLVERFGAYTGEILGDGYDEHAVDLFADKLQDLIHDKGLMERKGIAARRYVSEKHSFSKFEAVLRDITRGLNQ